MRMSGRPGEHPADHRVTRRGRRLRLAGLALVAAAAATQLAPEGAAAAPGERPTSVPRPARSSEQAITEAYTQAFTSGQAPGRSLEAVEDGPALASTLEVARQNFPQATASAQVAVSDIAVRGPREAGLRFHITYQGGIDFGVRDGTAVVRDGRWKVSRETYCLVMSWAGATCPPKAGRPPRDAVAARAAIQRAYTEAFTGGRDTTRVLAAVEDGRSLAGSLALALRNVPQLTSATSAATSDIVFTGPRDAWLRYRLSFAPGRDFGLLSGTAVHSDGRWKVSREAFCSTLSFAGVTCPPKAGRPPRDEAAARAAVQQAYAQAFTSGSGPEHALAAVEDGPALAATLEEARRNFPQATSTATVTTSDVVFTDPRNAWLRFHISYQGGVDFGVRGGTAVLSDGRWKVSRETYCTVMGWAGATCPAP